MIIVLLDNCWLQGNDKNKSKNGGKECLREQTYQSSIVQELSFLCPLLLVCPCVFVSPINCHGWLRAVVSVFIFITFYPIMGRSWCVVSVVEKQLQRWFLQELKTYVGENNASVLSNMMWFCFIQPILCSRCCAGCLHHWSLTSDMYCSDY